MAMTTFTYCSRTIINSTRSTFQTRLLHTSPIHCAIKPGSGQIQQIFDRNVKRLQRNRAALSPESRDADYLKDEIAERMVDRLLDIKRKFSVILDMGCGSGHIIKSLDTGLVDHLIQCDMSENALMRDANIESLNPVPTTRKVVDEEKLLESFEENSLDAVMSSLSLHWVNDLPGTLIQVKHALKPDGVFIGSMFGGDTLYELRTSLQLAEMERKGGIAPHVSPMTDVRDVSSLLQRAGFALTTVDVDEIIVNYPTISELMRDLQTMGENNAISARTLGLSKDVLIAASAIYKEVYGNEDGTIPATFSIIYMIGWKPDESQPKPLERGSGKLSLKTIEKTE
ncbi:hypothetical protein HK098_005825 [Nowakowskiella sp. JEL0407]|nr:hypothetical protein HK098_005825 [Nowakowskiella sp. JEL0407]